MKQPEEKSKFMDREKEVMQLLMQGYSHKMMAGKMKISKFTLSFHDNALKNKTNSKGKGETIAYG